MNNYIFNYTRFYKYIIQLPLVVFIFSVLFLSCKPQQKIIALKPKCAVDFKNAKVLAEQLKIHEFKFNTFDGKLDVEAIIDSSSNSFAISLRIKKDSIIWMSVSKIGIEAARVIVTKDSVSFLDRINNNYFKGDFAYLSKLLNFQLDYEILQSLLIGNSVSFYDDNERLKANVSDDCYYLLGTIRKNKLRKVMEKGKELKDPAQSIHLSAETFKIIRILFYDFNLNRSFDASFGNFTTLDSTQLFPTKINYSIKAQKNITINIEYKKEKLNEIVSFPFKIPTNYEAIIYKEK